MEERRNEETPRAKEAMEEEEGEAEEELTDAEIVELEEETDAEAQVDVAVNVELGDDTVIAADEGPADEMHAADVDAEEELTEVGPEEQPVSPQGSSISRVIEEGDEEVDRPAMAASKDDFDVLELPSIPTMSEDTVAAEDVPSQPDTLSSDVRFVTDADVVDERAEYADADETDVMEDEYEERPDITISRTQEVPGALLTIIS